MSDDQLGGARRTPQTPLSPRIPTPPLSPGTTRAERKVEEFADGEIRSYRGRVNGWLLVVYAVLAVWGVYYLFAFWGGLGPGQAR
jgi:hypothetical protein